jgi:hypothetical protein
MLNNQQFSSAGLSINCDAAAIQAVNQVEARGNGFLSNGKPKILFEGHIFWKQLLKVGIDPHPLQAGNEDILYPTWDLDKVRPFYKMDQYTRLDKAKAIHEEAALKSASWGAFQIMGFNHKACGYDTVKDFVNAQADEFNQLQCFCNYIRSTHLDVNLRNHDWKGFARGYNGPDYWKNQYDTKLQRAFDGFKNGS